MADQPEQAVVSRVHPDQWVTYREVRLAALTDAPDAFSSNLDRELAFDEEVWRGRLGSNASFLAWHDGKPVGTITVLEYDESHNHPYTGAWHLVAMWVSPKARRLGVGGRLVATVAEHARAAGAPSIVLWVFEANSSARHLYQRTGFRPTELRDSRPGNPDDIEILMIRELA